MSFLDRFKRKKRKEIDSQEVNEEKVLKILDKTRKLFNKHHPTIPEIILAYGNLGYMLGASMAGCEGVGPSEDEIRRAYYSKPTVDVAFMAQGLEMTRWRKHFEENPKLSNLGKKNREKKENE